MRLCPIPARRLAVRPAESNWSRKVGNERLVERTHWDLSLPQRMKTCVAQFLALINSPKWQWADCPPTGSPIWRRIREISRRLHRKVSGMHVIKSICNIIILRKCKRTSNGVLDLSEFISFDCSILLHANAEWWISHLHIISASVKRWKRSHDIYNGPYNRKP